MVKVFNPAHSQTASGRLGGVIFQDRTGGTVAHLPQIQPPRRATPAQAKVRNRWNDTAFLYNFVKLDIGIYSVTGDTLRGALDRQLGNEGNRFARFQHNAATLNYNSIENADHFFDELTPEQRLQFQRAERIAADLFARWQPQILTPPQTFGAKVYAVVRICSEPGGIQAPRHINLAEHYDTEAHAIRNKLIYQEGGALLAGINPDIIITYAPQDEL